MSVSSRDTMKCNFKRFTVKNDTFKDKKIKQKSSAFPQTTHLSILSSWINWYQRDCDENPYIFHSASAEPWDIPAVIWTNPGSEKSPGQCQHAVITHSHCQTQLRVPRDEVLAEGCVSGRFLNMVISRADRVLKSSNMTHAKSLHCR